MLMCGRGTKRSTTRTAGVLLGAGATSHMHANPISLGKDHEALRT